MQRIPQRFVRRHRMRHPGEGLPENWQEDRACAGWRTSLRRIYLQNFGDTEQMYKQEDYVEAYWHLDDNWYPAKILQVKGNGKFFLVHFTAVGWSKKMFFLPLMDLRKTEQAMRHGG
jgi:hypothetical protein